MMNYFKKLFCLKLLIILILIIHNCAIVKSPQGGKVDNEIPIVISTKPENGTVNFKNHQIEINFNEKIDITDKQNIFITPSIEEEVKVYVKKRKIILKLPKKDVFDSNLTYQINFINNIEDITEGNKLQKFRFYFTKGSKVDSLKINGKVISIEDNMPVSNVSIILLETRYITQNLFNLKKEYISAIEITDKNGHFAFENIHPSDYLIFAYEDANNNKKIEENERIGFKKYKKDSAEEMIIFLFPQLKRGNENKLVMINNHEFYMVFNQKVKIEKIEVYDSLNKTIKCLCSAKKQYAIDSIYCWITDELKINNHYRCIVEYYNEKKDSYDIIPKKISVLDSIKIKNLKTTLLKNDEFLINFGSLITKINVNKIKIIKEETESKNKEEITLDTNFPYYIKITNLEENKKYKIRFEDSSIVFFNKIIALPFELTFETLKNEEFGSINLEIENKSSKKIIIELINGKKEVVESKEIEDKTDNITYDKLYPGIYLIKYYFDENNNGNWDTGDIINLTEPENMIILKKQYNVKKNWEYIDKITIKD